MLLGPPEPTVLEEQQLPRKVAIIPFVNKTSNPDAANIVRKMFYNFFSSLNYLDLEPFVIDDNLKRNGLYSSITSGEPISAVRLGQLPVTMETDTGSAEFAKAVLDRLVPVLRQVDEEVERKARRGKR